MTNKKTNNQLVIRLATIDDMNKIEKVMKCSMEVLGQGHYTQEQIKSSCQFVCVPDRQIIEDETFFIVEDEVGEMIGCGGWSFRNTLYAGPKAQPEEDSLLDPKKDMARIRAMFVLPSVSGKGVGSMILSTSEKAAKKYGFNRGTLGATQSGLEFYKSKGWTSIKEEQAFLPDGVKIAVTQMEKAL